MQRVLFIMCSLLAFAAPAASAQQPVFDTHVHLRDGEASLRDYRADVAKSGAALSGLEVMAARSDAAGCRASRRSSSCPAYPLPPATATDTVLA